MQQSFLTDFFLQMKSVYESILSVINQFVSDHYYKLPYEKQNLFFSPSHSETQTLQKSEKIILYRQQNFSVEFGK